MHRSPRTGHRAARPTLPVLMVALVLLAACTVPAAVPAPAPPAPDLGIRIETFLAASRTGRFDQVRAIVVEVAGRRQYVRGDPAARVDVRSVTKSVTATLVGIALDDGVLRDVGESVAELLPSYAQAMPPPLRAARLRDVLTMTAGTAPDRALDARPPGPEEDWVSYAVGLEPRTDPGTRFEYSSVGSHLLAAALAQALGRPVLDYARERLFDPLGIDTGAGSGFAWEADPQGRPLGGSGLQLSADEMVEFGRLHLDGGRRADRQVVPAWWVAEATRAQVPTQLPLPGYGYQWWVTEAGGHPAYAALGYGGQLIEIVPALRMVVAVTSDVGAIPGASPEAYAELVARVIAPTVDGAG